MIEIIWDPVTDERIQARIAGFTALISMRDYGWGWTVFRNDARGAHWDGGICSSLDEAKEAAEKIMRR